MIDKKTKNKSLWSYVVKYKKTIVLMLFVLLFAVCLGRCVNYLNSYIVNNVIENSNLKMLAVFGSVIGGILIIEAVFYFIQNKTLSLLGYKIAGDIRRDLYDKIIYAPLDYYETFPVANILSKTTTFINDLGNFFTKNLIPFLINLFKFVAVFGFMFAINALLALIILGVLLVILLVVFVLSKLSKKKNRAFKKMEIARDEVIVDSVYGHQTILTNGGKEKQIEKFDALNEELNKTWQKFVKVNEAFLPIIEGIWFLGIVLVFVFAYAFISGDTFNVGEVIAFIGYITQTTDPIQLVALNYQSFINIRGTIEKIFEIFSIDTSSRKKRNVKFSKDSFDIKFENVSSNNNFKSTNIQDFNLTIPFGKKVLLTGSGGSGKTTIAYLLSRFYTATEGRILFDKVDINSIENESFKNSLGILTGEACLFEETLAENIRIAKPTATDEDVLSALKQAGLAKVVESLPEGIYTIMKLYGDNLSKGQRQLVGLARLILQNPKVVVIDEAFDSVDEKNKKRFFVNLEKYVANKTCIYISATDVPELKCDETIRIVEGKIEK